MKPTIKIGSKHLEYILSIAEDKNKTKYIHEQTHTDMEKYKKYQCLFCSKEIKGEMWKITDKKVKKGKKFEISHVIESNSYFHNNCYDNLQKQTNSQKK